MKKYRLTKITVKTREIVSVSENATDETAAPICPVCHSSLYTSLTAAEDAAAERDGEARLTKLLPAEKTQ